MKCLACQEEVSQRAIHAVAANCCPFCGGQIMEPALQEALNKLREVMTSIDEQDFTSSAEEWLKSNFDLISTNSHEYQSLQKTLTDFQSGLTMAQTELAQVKKELDEMKTRALGPIPKSGRATPPPGVQLGVDKQGQTIQLQGEQILDPAQTTSFLQRAGAHKSVANISKIKELANKLNKSGGETDTNLWAMAMDPSTQMDEIDPYAGTLPADPYDDEDRLDPVAEQFAAMGANSATYNAKDVAGLQAQHAKVAGAAKELAYGGSAGKIVRAG